MVEGGLQGSFKVGLGFGISSDVMPALAYSTGVMLPTSYKKAPTRTY